MAEPRPKIVKKKDMATGDLGSDFNIRMPRV